MLYEWKVSFCNTKIHFVGTLVGLRDCCHSELFFYLLSGGSAPNFWSTFSTRAEEILRVSEESRRLREILPGVDVGRFLSGDEAYIQDRVFLHVDSMKMQQEQSLPKMLTLADQYNIEQWQVKHLKHIFVFLV